MTDRPRPTAGPPVVLTIAGSDNSAGAGVQTDLRTISVLGGYGLTAVTCVVAEVPGKVAGIQAVRPELLAQQIRLCFEAFPVAAVKTGMLYSKALIQVVADELARAGKRKKIPLVIDPVMVASSGDVLLQPGAVRAYWKDLFPLARVLTPNLDELSFLTGRKCGTEAELLEAARELGERTGVAILAKGGHLRGGKKAEAVDVLCDGEDIREFRAPYFAGRETHGTGCTYSAALATALACGLDLPRAVVRAKELITRAIGGQYFWRGPGFATRALRIEADRSFKEGLVKARRIC